MEDIINKLTNILNTKEGQEQLKNIQSVLAPMENSNSNNNGFDMSALSSMLGGIMGNNQPQNNIVEEPQPNTYIQEEVPAYNNNVEQALPSDNSNSNSNSNGFDMSALSSMLGGLMGNNNEATPPNDMGNSNNNGFDMSALSSMLGGLMGNNNEATPPNDMGNSNNNGFDMSALSSMLGGLMGNSNEATPPNGNSNNNGFDMSALSSMLGGGNGGLGDLGGIDMNMILNLQKIFAGLNKNDKNTQLLQALKPHLSEKRCKKVDHAISFLRLFAMLPALKESGIFKGL